VKHKICHCVHECQHPVGIRLISKWQKITNLSVFFEQHHIVISAACCLTVPLSHNGCLANFCIYQVIKRHDIHFLCRCLIFLYVVLNAEKFNINSYMLAVWQTVELYNVCYHFILVCLPLDTVTELTCWLRWCALQYSIKHLFILTYHIALLWKLQMSALFTSNGCSDWWMF
jgi:hypothetical protein